MINQNDTQVLFIDIQEKMMPAIFNHDKLEQRLCLLARCAKVLKLPILVTRQYPKGLGDTIPALIETLGEHDITDKTAFSCLRDENGFKEKLLQSGRKNLIVAGVEAHICVQQTVLDALAIGITPIIPADCIGSRSETDRLYAEQRMARSGAVLTTMESILFEIMESAAHPARNDIQGLIR